MKSIILILSLITSTLSAQLSTFSDRDLYEMEKSGD